MKENKFNWGLLAVSLLIIAMGVLCVVFPNETGGTLCVILGVFLIVAAVLLFLAPLISKKPLLGNSVAFALVLLIFGIFVLTNKASIGEILKILFAALIIFNGANAFVSGLVDVKQHVKGGLVVLIVGVVLLALGCVVLFSGFDSIIVITGIALIIDGLSNIGMLLFAKKSKAKSTKTETTKTETKVIELKNKK